MNEILWRGSKFRVEALELGDGSCPSKDFLNSLTLSEKAKIDALFDRLCSLGRIPNPEQFKKLEGTELYEFKSYQIRIYCCYVPGRRVILLYGLRKKSDRHKPADIQRAERYRKWLLEQEENDD